MNKCVYIYISEGGDLGRHVRLVDILAAQEARPGRKHQLLTLHLPLLLGRGVGASLGLVARQLRDAPVGPLLWSIGAI